MNLLKNCLLLSLGLFATSAIAESQQAEVNFSKEVLPILSDRCFHCHGPDESHRKANLRLDLETEAKRDRDGYQVVVPGDVEGSDLWYRITTDDEDDLMPPPDSHRKPLSAGERDVLKRWLEQGAKWGNHWAFERPVRSTLRETADHPVDFFVRQKLEKTGFEPAAPAPLHTQLRRLSFDLTGLPPTPEQVEAFTSGAQSWDQAIEAALASPHHGERLAMWWLDAARYSDTDGYQQDKERTNWPWRDWVVNAFNDNMPFDQFTIEQFAGDLLPNATPEQKLATCFHRNHMTNGEGGRIPEESRIDYVIDRVNTTGTVWLGLTLGCVQCHTHKFDPITHQDYYQMFAFFNSIDEDGKAGTAAKPYMKYKSPHTAVAIAQAEDHLKVCREDFQTARVAAEERFKGWLTETRKTLTGDYRAWVSPKPASLESVNGTEFQVETDRTVQTAGPTPRQDDYWIQFDPPTDLERLTGWKLEVFPHASHQEGKFARATKGNGEFILTNVKLLVSRKEQSQVRDIEMRSAVADFTGTNDTYKKVSETLDDDPRKGWTTVGAEKVEPHTVVYELREPLELHPDDQLTLVLLHRSTDGFDSIGRFRISMTDQRGEAVRKLATAPMEELAALSSEATVPGALLNRLRGQYLLDDAVYQHFLQRQTAATNQVNAFKKAAGELNVQVLAEREKPRETHILERGVWDAKGDAVKRGVLPAVLPWEPEKAQTRLDLAKWLVAPENPLTSRVIVNHLWQMMFGAGLVRTTEDFGLQGESPTHPELLDWLAVELVENQWDLRHILRLITTSETYRQSSELTPELLERDPENRMLARAPRFRLPAWMIRDNALQSAGLLNPALGGPPVKPWQPEGVWREIFMGRFTYQPSVGPAQYRRTLYTFWRRSSAPTFLFDSAQRRVCEVGVRRTNTPLHALTLMNDTTMLEAARVLADQATGLQPLAMQVLSRELELDEISVLERERQRALDFYQTHPDEAIKLATVGQQSSPPTERAPGIAAWMTVASMMLNLDEAITHE